MVDELAALILPWAKEHKLAEYQQTLKVSSVPPTFAKYMIRLVELRMEEDPAWMRQVPLTILDETRAVMKVRYNGKLFEVKGKRASKPRQLAFTDLLLSKAEFAAHMMVIETLDLERVE